MATPLNTPMLPGLGGGTGGVQLQPGQLQSSTTQPMVSTSSIPSPTMVNNIQTTPGNVNTQQPSPKPASTSTQNSTNPQAPALSSPGGAVPLPTVNQSLASPQMTTGLAEMFGTKATTPNVNSDLTTKMNALHGTVKGTEAPPGNPMRSQEVQTKMDGMGAQTEPDAAATFVDAYASMNPVEKNIYDFYTQQFSHQATQESFAEEFAKAFSDVNNPAGIPGESLGQEQLQYMNLKNIMDGTEDDIRNEITKTGGFATESQVLALTGARNKTLMKQANVLLQSMALKQDYVDQIMKFTEMDRDEVEKQLDRKLGLGEKILDIESKMKSAAKDNYQKVVDKVGYADFAKMFDGNATAMRAAEKSLGLPGGTLSNPAFLAAAAPEDELQFVSGTANQQSGVFNKTKGTFEATGGGGPAAGGGGGGSMAGMDKPYYDAFRNAIIGVGPQSIPTLKQNFESFMAQGDLVGARNYLTGLAIERVPAQDKTTITGRAQLVQSMNDIQGYLAALEARGIHTNLVTGTVEDTLQKLGKTQDPDLAYIKTSIAIALQQYRRSMSGVAFSPGESKEYQSIMPSLYSEAPLNISKMNALRDSMNSNNRVQLATYMGGPSTYDAIYGPSKKYGLPSTSTSISELGGTPGSSSVDFGKINTSPDNFMEVDTPDGRVIYKKMPDGTYDIIK